MAEERRRQPQWSARADQMLQELFLNSNSEDDSDSAVAESADKTVRRA